MTVDYKSTVFLPRSEFAMRAKLPEREPETLRRWAEMDLFARLRADSQGREPFILHDGPPYANGHLHMGHGLNKVLKDVINRSQQMQGKNAHYVPGWDCHGLPIEWKVEEEYRAKGKSKDEVSVVEFRRQCRDFAEHWIKVQTDEFRRLGVEGDWERPYTTMSFAAEAHIVREVGKFLLNGGLYRGARPVLWSVVEKTALADAEVEYQDHTSNTVWVQFPILSTDVPALAGASALIWTTTPWTLPGNRAIAFDAKADYVVFEVTQPGEGSLVNAGACFLVAQTLLNQVLADLKVTGHRLRGDLAGSALTGTLAAHPLRGEGYDYDVPLLAADFVTMDQGTGLVHIAPGHGADDYELGRRHGLPTPMTVDGDGVFVDQVPLFAGRVVYTQEGKAGDADPAVIEALRHAGRLAARGRLRHSYPHSWRSKAPLIFRNTPQWFISMETNGLREKALKAIDDTRFVPAAGKSRLYGMIEGRPDWCVSRQRLWGVPLPIFVHKQSGEPLRDQAVVDRVAAAFEAEGADAWFDSDPQRFLGNDHDAADFEQVTDVVEVWFDSGSTHSFVLEDRPELRWPADLYLEGSDQHRGWFHTSLLESAGTRGRAPYDAVLTHGFVLDENGRKMSKSLGNITSPQKVIEQHGADILRLWVVASDYSEDIRIGREILRYQIDAYRRLRNTLRYLLGNLAGFDESERLPVEEMPELERYVLHRLYELDQLVRSNSAAFDFHAIYQALHNFCAVELSAFYFDIRKDSLYCDSPKDPRRRACRSVLDAVFGCLTAWLAPILCFTAEEAWWARDCGKEESVHLRQFPEVPETWHAPELAARWETLRQVRRVITGALELERAEKRLGSSLQAHPTVYIDSAPVMATISGVDLAEIAITSGITVVEGETAGGFRLEDVADIAVVPGMASGEKCQRCWRVLPDVGSHRSAPGCCARCAEVVSSLAGDRVSESTTPSA